MDVPDVVRKYLDELCRTPGTLQSPNFDVNDYQYHEPVPEPRQPIRGFWTVNGVDEFEFELIAQLSARHTMITNSGDLALIRSRNKQIDNPYADVLRAKHQLSIAAPHSRSLLGHAKVIHAQFDAIDAMERTNIAAGFGSAKRSFAFKSREGWRATALSNNIYCNKDFEDGDVIGSNWPDRSGTFKLLSVEEQSTLVVTPFTWVDAAGRLVDDLAASRLFVPGSWVSVRCSMRVWDKRNLAGANALHHATRSYQVHMYSVQWLARGRLNEGALLTLPVLAGTKRKFKSLIADAGDEDGADKDMHLT